jgi:flagellar hook protein FlgE
MGTQTSLGTTALTFDSSGKLTSPAGNVSGITASGLADGAADLKFQWNLYSSTGAPLLTEVSGPNTTSSALRRMATAADR